MNIYEYEYEYIIFIQTYIELEPNIVLRPLFRTVALRGDSSSVCDQRFFLKDGRDNFHE